MAGEFELIHRYFEAATTARPDVLLGIGDDCALLQMPPDRVLAVSTDTLVSGRHFEPDVDPVALGHKALAVNLSDLAAMGADPAWATLALTLPQADEAWLASFMKGFAGLADAFGVQLVGGDTTRGPLSITLTVFGFLSADAVLRRDAARPGDRVYVSGTLGDAGLALAIRQGRLQDQQESQGLGERLDRPQPRVRLGQELAACSRCCVDVSDGLLADLAHICERSGVGAVIELEKLPLSPALQQHVRGSGDWTLPLSAGDDYELLFTVPEGLQEAFARISTGFDVAVSCIGRIEKGERVRMIDSDGQAFEPKEAGYDHFRV